MDAVQINTTQNGPLRNNSSSSKSPVENERFAFEKTQFARADFTVYRFIYLAGKRSNLEQIHADLRGYLRELQNSMVGLINDDYADFVNLSSKLAALKDSIDKVTSDINSAWGTFASSTTTIRKTSEGLHKKSIELKTSRMRQISFRNKISLIDSLNKLADCLSSRPADVSKKWFVLKAISLHSAEFWSARIPELEIAPKVANAKDTCFEKARLLVANDLIDDLRGECQLVGLTISALYIIGHLDHGTQVTTELIHKSIESSEKNEVKRLKSIYEQVFKLRTKWITNCQTNNQLTKEVEHFLDDALLKFILSHLDKNIGELCIPSEATTFFVSYNSTVQFAQQFPHIQDHPNFLKGLNDRFNVNLYVKRISSILNEDIQEKLQNTKIVWRENLKDDEHPLEASASILKAVEHMFSSQVFLPIVADRFWEATIQLINKHCEWIDLCLSSEPTRVVDELSGSVTVLDRWPDLVTLLAGSKRFDSSFFHFCLKTVFVQFEKIGADPGPFRQFLNEYNGKMEIKRNEIQTKILQLLSEVAVKKLSTGVGEIPKRYRWTKKPSPTEPSPYIAEALEVQTNFGETATRRAMEPEMIMSFSESLLNGMVDCFLENAQQVLSSVQLTGSSLQRFKRKGANVGESNGKSFGESDEAKIGKQLYLDTQQMRLHAESANGKTEALDAFLKQLDQQENI
ncbi:Component of oligomeric Golgi complex 2 [Aphelenchoides bicaudatus]|nr:Component of oligomeric Golgi complex 2 [Aphelenchoides bicaudatus]